MRCAQRIVWQLAAASVEDVGKMLACMNLQRYVPAFAEEQISGLEFLELTEDMLKGKGVHNANKGTLMAVTPDDLDVKSGLHRMRILKAIEKSKTGGATAC